MTFFKILCEAVVTLHDECFSNSVVLPAFIFPALVIKDGQIENYRHSIWRLLRGKASQQFCKESNVNEHRLNVSLITCLLS